MHAQKVLSPLSFGRGFDFPCREGGSIEPPGRENALFVTTYNQPLTSEE